MRRLNIEVARPHGGGGGWNRQEASKIFKQLNFVSGQGRSLFSLAWLFYADGQFDAAKEAPFQAIYLSLDEGNDYLFCHVTVSSVMYIALRAKQRSLTTTTTRQPSGSHPLPAGTISCFGFITPRRCCPLDEVTPTPTLNEPSRPRSMTHTI